ncbi:hypothetical protein [Nocardia niigatensis]|uniref:hypothetical protein n=1 Tax=Nocardia niigatensis TaxID=209249 RepID=UPI0002DA333C|nr:hypothetical protein [Nocardia niigatensis]
MTSIDEAPDDSRQEYDWGLAPPHLQTRRQLRAAGLGPNRQNVAALMVRKSKGRRLIAHLFDVRKAAPKRVPTPAQLDAIRKATVEHQARAAERHGITRAELTESTAPAPGWEHTPQEGNTMSDNKAARGPAADSALDIHRRAGELETAFEEAREVGSEDEAIRAEHAFEAHLREYRSELSTDPYWNGHLADLDRADNQAVTPHGHNQRIAFLLATVAANQARVDDAALAQAVDNARTEGPEAVEALRARSSEDQTAAEARMQSIPWHNLTATVKVFSDALLWAGNSEIAQQALSELTGRYASQWGVVVDPETFSVRVDPDFDAWPAQDRADAERLWQRESAVLDFVTGMGLRAAAKGQVAEAITAWRDQIDPGAPLAHLNSENDRRAALAAALATSTVSGNDRASVEFAVDYLRGKTRAADLLASPVFVDPGEEARGRIPRVLEVFRDNPNAARFVGEEIAVMTAADQATVREVGKKIARGEQVELDIWPGYTDRYAIREQIIDYAADTAELRAEADYLAEGGMTAEEHDRFGVVFARGNSTLSDEVHKRIARMADSADELRSTISAGKGLAAIERAQLSETLADIDAGRIADRENLPELLFADERSKADAEAMRISATASVLSSAAREDLAELIQGAGVRVDHRNDRLRYAVTSISDSIYTVACGSRSGDLPADRKTYMDRRDRLAQALAQEKVHPEIQKDIRALVDGRARQAGEIGRAAAARTDQWTAKIDRVVATRDDQIAQRRAANAGRSTSPGRACTTRPDPSAAQEHPRARTATYRKNSHEIGR